MQAQRINENQVTTQNTGITRHMFPNVMYQTISQRVVYDNLLSFLPHQPTSLVYRDAVSHRWNQGVINTQPPRKEMQASRSVSLPSSVKGNYTPHDPIWIEGDEAFIPENGVSSGSGTVDDPYIIEGWAIVSQSEVGIVIVYTRSHFLVRNCYLETDFGVATYDVTNGTFESIIFNCSNSVGLQLELSSNIALHNSTISAWTGIQTNDLDNCTIKNCTFSCSNPGGFGVGLSLMYAPFFELSSVTVQGYNVGIELFFSPHSSISDCEVFNNFVGVALLASSHQTLKRNHLYNNLYNLDIEGLIIEGHTIGEYEHDIDESNTINGKPVYYLYNTSDLVFDETSEVGFLGFVHCTNITVRNMALGDNGVGLLFVDTSDSAVSSCTFPTCMTAIGVVYGSQGNLIEKCQTGDASIYLGFSPHNVMRNNTLGKYSFGIYGDSLQDFYQDINQSNTADGIPMYYFVEKNHLVLKESNVGYLAFINCKNIHLSNVAISGLYDGLLLVRSRVVLRNCSLTSNYVGIHVLNKSLAWVFRSTISSNDFGFEFEHASATAIVHCDISGNMVGLDFTGGHHIIIRDCNITNNGINGFQIANSRNNLICRNNISGNGWGAINMEGDCQKNEIVDNTISSGYTGILMMQEIPLSMNPDEVLLSPTQNTIHHNMISQMTFIGVDPDIGADSNSIEYNTITENEEGLFLWSCGENNTMRYNNIYGNHYGARAWNCHVNVSSNWWGSEDGPSGIGHGTGDPIIPVHDATIEFTPWLEQKVDTKFTDFRYFFTVLRARLQSVVS